MRGHLVRFGLSALVLVPLAIWASAYADPPQQPAEPTEAGSERTAAEVQQAPETDNSEGARQERRGSEESGQPSDEQETVTKDQSSSNKTAVVDKGLAWLAEAQHESGGWGAGSHARQNIRDPHAVKTDPATTAFTACAFLRAGHSPLKGKYQHVVAKATKHLVTTVSKAPSEGPLITDIKGTQPQSKLGPLVDTTVTAQYLARVLPLLPENNPLHGQVDSALEKCLAKLEKSQQKDGSWVAGGWAPVLQSSLGNSALEYAQAAGKPIDLTKLERARNYQRSNISTSGRASTRAAAGVELYSFAGGLKANASDAKAARDAIQEAKKKGSLPASAPVSEESLEKLGYDEQRAAQLAQAVEQTKAQSLRLGEERLLRGFGNNGGEEFLSYLMTSESLVVVEGKDWQKWNDKMQTRLSKIQNPDGSWSGHHCITSPVFCTAAVIQCLTAEADKPLLAKIAEESKKQKTATEGAAKPQEDPPQSIQLPDAARGSRSSSLPGAGFAPLDPENGPQFDLEDGVPAKRRSRGKAEQSAKPPKK